MRCDYCLKTFTNILSWTKHMTYELNNNIVSTACLNCKVDLKDKFRLGVHLNSRICRDDTYPKDQCYRCSKYFTSRATLSRHLKDRICVTSIEVARLLNRTYKCFICFKAFDSQGGLLKHSQMDNCSNHDDDRPKGKRVLKRGSKATVAPKNPSPKKVRKMGPKATVAPKSPIDNQVLKSGSNVSKKVPKQKVICTTMRDLMETDTVASGDWISDLICFPYSPENALLYQMNNEFIHELFM